MGILTASIAQGFAWIKSVDKWTCFEHCVVHSKQSKNVAAAVINARCSANTISVEVHEWISLELDSCI